MIRASLLAVVALLAVSAVSHAEEQLAPEQPKGCQVIHAYSSTQQIDEGQRKTHHFAVFADKGGTVADCLSDASIQAIGDGTCSSFPEGIENRQVVFKFIDVRFKTPDVIATGSCKKEALPLPSVHMTNIVAYRHVFVEVEQKNRLSVSVLR